MNKIEQLYRDQPQAPAFAKGYLDYLQEVLRRLDVAAIARFIDTLLAARDRGARIFFLGNGGSAATASHFANDLAIGCGKGLKPFRALSLTDNLAMVTAIGNDCGYEEIFCQQLQAQVCPGDVVVAISASGNSPNVIKAVEYANGVPAETVALTGFDGGRLSQVANLVVHVPTAKAEYGPVEDVHLILDHLVSSFIINLCREEQECQRPGASAKLR
jgi:D-sedoheptulose 7-phosphate isomerase